MKRHMSPRKQKKLKNKESHGAGILATSNNNGRSPDNSASETDEEIVKRNRIIQRRKSMIESEKGKRNAGSTRTPGQRRGEKRKSQGNISGRESEQDFSSDPDNEQDSDNENRTRNRNKRFRRRLSKKVDNERAASSSQLNISYGNLNNSVGSPSVHSPTKSTPTDKKTLQEIYSTCSALFQAHRITPQNAFSLKLVECLDEIIKSDDFDNTNLPMMARTLEIGGKIYVCRVDCAHSHTIKLATEIAANQHEPNDNDQVAQMEDNDVEDAPEDGKGRKKAARTKKRSRFIEDNDSKLNTRFEDQSSKYATRRTSLKAKLHRNIEEELDFDYLTYFLKPDEEHPIEKLEEFEALGKPGAIPDSHVNDEEFKNVPWLPFNILNAWDASKFDIWGIPLPSTDPLLDMSSLQRPTQPEANNDDEFAYNPETRPDEYPEPEAEPNENGNGFGGDDFMDDHFDDVPNGTMGRPGLNASQPLNIDKLKSLDDLKKFFSSLKGLQLVLKNKYGWAGPIFIKPHRPDMKKRAGDGKNPKKAERRKKIMLMDYDEVDWKDKNNRYVDGGSSKTTMDDKTLAKWSTSKTVTPYCNSNNFLGIDEDEEDYRDPFDNVDSNEDYMANIVRFFVDSNRNIFKLMEEEFKEGKDVLSQSIALGQGIHEDEGFQDLDLEAPRDYSDDSIGNVPGLVEPEADVENFAGDHFTGMNLTSMFPGSLGVDSNDPFSKVSEFDSVKFSKQPKPIDMHAMKVVIRQILTEKLLVDDEGKPTLDEETKVDLFTLVTEMMKRVDGRMAKHMSVAIVIVGLMHVVADNKFFMISNENAIGFDNPWIVCRGKIWRHKDNIPMARFSYE